MNLLCDSFATYTSFQNRGWIDPFGTFGVVASPGRFDTFCATNFISQGSARPIGVNANTLFAGLAWKPGGAISGIIFAFLDSASPLTSKGTNQVELKVNTDFTIQAQRNGTLLGSHSTATYTPGAWHYLEIGVLIDPTVGTVTIKLDGVTIINLTGQNTRATANSSANQISIYDGGSSSVIDDLYVNDNSGSLNNTFLGDIKVVGSTPTGDSATSAWTQNIATRANSTVYAIGVTILDSNSNLQRVTTAGTSAGSPPTWNVTVGGSTTDGSVSWINLGTQAAYKLVNERNPDEDSSYLSDATVNDQARFTFPAVSGSGVLAVAVYARARKDDAGTRSIRLVAESGGTVGDNGSDLPQSSTYQNFSAVFETDPNTSAAWTVANVNAAEFGVKTTA